MFGKHHTLRHLSAAITIAFAFAIVAAGSASAGRAHGKTCRDGTTWITVIDDQGVSTLEPTGKTTCTEALACTSATDRAMRSPYLGWVIVNDDLGIPWLYPVGQALSTASPECTQTPAAPATSASPVKPASAPTSPITPSPYPGWVFVTDDTGVPWLYPVGQAGS
jgi:hypothetical protein